MFEALPKPEFEKKARPVEAYVPTQAEPQAEPMRPTNRPTSGISPASRLASDNSAEVHRAAHFREPLIRRCQRLVLAVAYLLLPKRIAQLPALARAVAASWLRGGVACPAEADVYANPEGFAGLVRNPTPATLLAAHRRGFFPQAHMGPQQWWTREQRYVQVLSERRIPKTLRNEMRKARLTVTFDQAFDDVIKACAEPRPGRPKLTWITPKIMHLYSQMHAGGDAHSFEVWGETGELVGGGYGVAVGRIFVTESLFSRTGSASKMALQSLNYHLGAWGFVLNDVKDFAPHMAGMGSRHILRAEYSALLGQYGEAPLPALATMTAWRPHASLAEIVEASMPPKPEAARSSQALQKEQRARPRLLRPIAVSAGPKPENPD